MKGLYFIFASAYRMICRKSVETPNGVSAYPALWKCGILIDIQRHGSDIFGEFHL